jgi:DNA polymerase-1
MYKLVSPSDIPTLTKECKIVACDTETTGFDFWKHKLVYFQFATGDGNAYMVKADKFCKEIQQLLWDDKIGKVFHKSAFDVNFLNAAGYEIRNIAFDTKIGAYLLNNCQENGLKDLAKVYLRVKNVIEFDDIVPRAERAKKGQPKPVRKTIADVPIESVINYACADADHTRRLYDLFQPEVHRAGFDHLMEMELAVQEVIIRMEKEGCKIDTAKVDKLRLEVQKERFQKMTEIKQILGPAIDINSPKQLAEALYENLGLPVCGLSKTTGMPSTDVKSLESLKHDHAVIPLLLDYKKYEKLLTTYLEPIPELIDNHDCIHGSFNQCVTDTGRLSSSEPNLQNIPVKTPLGREFRNCFVSRFPGGKLFVADYSQIEVRILAHLSQDPRLLKAFKEDNADMHTLTATLLFHKKAEEVTKDMRSIAKTLNFGVIYGMSANKLSLDAHLDYDEAEGYIEAWFNTYSGVRTYRDQCKAFLEEKGYIETILGRKLLIAEGKFIGTRALNYPIQGSAAEIIKKAMVKCYAWIKEEGLKTIPVLQVHDELVFDVPKDEQKLVKIKLPALMNNVVPLSVDLPVDVHLVTSWGQAKE